MADECNWCDRKLSDKQLTNTNRCIYDRVGNPYCSNRCYASSERSRSEGKQFQSERLAELPPNAIYKSIYWNWDNDFIVEWFTLDNLEAQKTVWKLNYRDDVSEMKRLLRR